MAAGGRPPPAARLPARAGGAGAGRPPAERRCAEAGGGGAGASEWESAVQSVAHSESSKSEEMHSGLPRGGLGVGLG